MSGSGDGFDGDVKLGVISIAMETETIVAYDGTKRKHIKETLSSVEGMGSRAQLGIFRPESDS